MMTSAAGELAIPSLSANIPTEMRIPGESPLLAPLTIALLDACAITDAMLAGPYGEDEHRLSVAALTTWWSDLLSRYPLRHFHWRLHVQELSDIYGRLGNTPSVGWFCMTRAESGDGIPRWSLQRKIAKLEKLLPGLGQTVLAILRDATAYLPESLTPWQATEWAQWIYWEYSETDEELLEMRREMEGFETVAQMREEMGDHGFPTREEYFSSLPEWVTIPERTVSRVAADDVTNKWARKVISACDAISSWAVRRIDSAPELHVGCQRHNYNVTDGAMVLLWREGDSIGQAIDDAINWFMEDDVGTSSLDMEPVELTSSDIRKYQARTEQIIQLAALVEPLLDLIGDPI
jgi:PRTRC genetic system protein F